MLNQETSTIAQWAGGAAVALVIIAASLQKFFKGWKSTSAETEVIDMLREEVARLGTQNTKLAVELNRLQTELVQLNSQLARMAIENGRLHAEVQRLTEEVTRLQSMLPQAEGDGA